MAADRQHVAVRQVVAARRVVAVSAPRAQGATAAGRPAAEWRVVELAAEAALATAKDAAIRNIDKGAGCQYMHPAIFLLIS
jgi:hypothetical protein